MKIHRLAPMSVTEYATHYLGERKILGENTIKSAIDPVALFSSSIESIKKLAFAPYFWFITDYRSLRIVEVDTHAKNHLIQTQLAWLTKHPENWMSLIHPEDIEMKFAYNYFQESYLGTLNPERRRHMKFNTFIRMLDTSGSYRWYMFQMPDYHYDAQGKLMYSLKVAYDVSHLKKDSTAMMTMLDDSNLENQVFLCTSHNFHQQPFGHRLPLTHREKEVLALLCSGKLGKQIAGELGISPFTVENHKKNIFHKTNTRTASELIAFALKSGIV